MPELRNLIGEALDFNFKDSAKGVADVGRKYLSQAVQIIAICRAIDLSKLDTREKRKTLERVHSSIQAALDSVKVTKLCSDSQDTKRAKLAKAVATLIDNAETLGLEKEDIEKTMDIAREKDNKTAKRWIPIMQAHQIQQVNQLFLSFKYFPQLDLIAAE
ncbi:hypothetical protein FIBSPDRAFT_489343 [Athelia psychrophila]|uniref:Uncharacterized protein n=1 Tax=Athelia psychrophila TaxID=1759441 RepID=A0A166KU34_9AGAM|nr:hypothetical protein FIBSPDRAFT_489343 [Fibularhizoctonia sp. CBS 109695]